MNYILDKSRLELLAAADETQKYSGDLVAELSSRLLEKTVRAEAAEKERDEWRSLSAENKLAGMKWMEKSDLLKERAEAAEAKVKEMEAAARWIPVSERLPEANGEYLVYLKSQNIVTTMKFMIENKVWITYTLGVSVRAEGVTSWRELPQPPKPEGAE